jgi:hypothetical protein
LERTFLFPQSASRYDLRQDGRAASRSGQEYSSRYMGVSESFVVHWCVSLALLASLLVEATYLVLPHCLAPATSSGSADLKRFEPSSRVSFLLAVPSGRRTVERLVRNDADGRQLLLERRVCDA